ncbi:MAG TPA: hypothetical protein VFU16_12715 [Solirubrobacterales bacterium]|nr:hypothetical protein [Solirubrobacterales bacterium]
MRRRGKDFPKQQGDLRAETAERLEAIVEAAERAAASVIDDAEAQARRHLAQARAEADRMAESRSDDLADLVETLLGQAISLRREAEQLQQTLEAARTRIGVGPGERLEQPPAPEPPVPPRLRAVGAVEPEPAGTPSVRSADPAGARLLAAQLAVSGSSREEIAERLRNGFEIEDAEAILDAILGPEES